MKVKIIITTFFLVCSGPVFGLTHEIKLKSKDKPERYDVVNIQKGGIVIIKNGKEIELPAESIEYIKIIDKADTKFRKAVIFSSKEYRIGTIVYQDRKRLSIEVNGNLENHNIEDVTDIVDEKDFINEVKKNPKRALLYSAILPGAGQFYTYDRNFPAIFFSSVFLTSVFSSIYLYEQANTYHGKYEESRYENKDYYEKYKTRMFLSYSLASFAVLIYFWNLYDAYFNFKQKYNIKKSDNIEKKNSKVLLIDFKRYSFYGKREDLILLSFNCAL